MSWPPLAACRGLRAWKSEAVALLEEYAAAGRWTMEALRAAERVRDEERGLADLLAAKYRTLGGLEEAFDVSQQAWVALRRSRPA